MTSEVLLPVSCSGLIVNLMGVFFFSEYHSGSGYGDNLRGVYLHMLVDSLGSMGVILSTICVKYYGLIIADSLSSFILAIFILVSAIPFLK